MDKRIEINAAIFPMIMTFALGKPIQKNDNNKSVEITPSEAFKADIKIDLPRGTYLLYLQNVAIKDQLEHRLLEQYAYGMTFTDEDYQNLLSLIMTSTNRNWNQSIPQGDILTPFGVEVRKDNIGNQQFALIEDAVPSIKVETWECIIIDMLKKSALDIIGCFDFNKTFVRKNITAEETENLSFSLNAWNFSSDIGEQSLSTALRSAFMFTLVGYYFGDLKDQYSCFQDFFDSEFYKRVSLIFGMWSARSKDEIVSYVPLYESFHNLDGISKDILIKVIKAILDNNNIALDEKQSLKNRLIEGAGTFHNNINRSDATLEQNLIKPAVNFVLLREKAKETLASAQILCNDHKYMDCANRCYYAMMFSLKALLENKGQLAGWKANELKERETHDSLENGLSYLVTQGVLNATDKAAFDYVKDQRWKCDYSLYKFEKADAENCVNKAENFYSKIDSITA